MLFTEESRAFSKSLYEILNSDQGFVVTEFTKANKAGVKDPQGLFTKMWIFIHGIACMSLTGDYDLDDNQTLKMLKDTVKAFS